MGEGKGVPRHHHPGTGVGRGTGNPSLWVSSSLTHWGPGYRGQRAVLPLGLLGPPRMAQIPVVWGCWEGAQSSAGWSVFVQECGRPWKDTGCDYSLTLGRMADHTGRSQQPRWVRSFHSVPWHVCMTWMMSLRPRTWRAEKSDY